MLRDIIPAETVTACDLEPIHIPGSIQPHGILLALDPTDYVCVGCAGDAAALLGAEPVGRSLGDILAFDLRPHLQDIRPGTSRVLGRLTVAARDFNGVAFATGNYLAVELDPAEAEVIEAAAFIGQMDAASSSFDRAGSVQELCHIAATMFRGLIGYERVMIYQFLDDDSGVVIGESRAENARSFMNHHFPASDIPKQARALYLRNKVRVIPDADYVPQPIRSDAPLHDLDLSDSTLRSVSSVHLQYLKNMGVRASASFSIIKDNVLWGLVACHHDEPKQIPLPMRTGCLALANALSRQIRAKEEASLYRERLRLRSQEDSILSLLGSDRSLDEFLRRSGSEIAGLVSADGFAALQGGELFTFGNCPDSIDIREIADNIRIPAARQPFATASLSRQIKSAVHYRERASGLLAVSMATEVPTILLWFREEHIETVKWAGNPHKALAVEPGETLSPRASFAAWTENVRGKARRWTHAEKEAVSRIVKMMLEFRNNHRMRELNRELTTTLRENSNLISQKDFLLKEVNHRVQNSLQLVSAFLRLQARSADREEVKASLDEAQKRLNAVALVHRRLYQDDSVEIVDLGRYLEELVSDMLVTMDQVWADHLTLDLAPILISTDKAVNLGLVATELVINVQKYAYRGMPGPIAIKLEQHRNSFRMIVSDRGAGKANLVKGGFGSRMLSAIVERLGGRIDEEDNMPGLRVTVTGPIQEEV